MFKPKLVTICDPFHPNVRALLEGSNILFCGIDVAKVLGYRDPNSAIAYHCKNVVKRTVPHPQSKVRTIEMCFLNSEDVLRLAAASKRKNAMETANWYTGYMPDVVKRIAVHNTRVSVGVPKVCSICGDVLESFLANPSDKLNSQSPDLYEAAIQGSKELSETAHSLGVYEMDLYRILQDCGFLELSTYGHILPTIEYLGMGFFLVAYKIHTLTGKRIPYTVVTPKGEAFISRIIEEIWNQGGD